MAVFWVAAPFSLVEVYQREVPAASIIRETIPLMMEAARTSEPLVNFYQAKQRYNPEDSHLRTHRLENLKSYLERRILGDISYKVDYYTLCR
jgi:hypothetical protein